MCLCNRVIVLVLGPSYSDIFHDGIPVDSCLNTPQSTVSISACAVVDCCPSTIDVEHGLIVESAVTDHFTQGAR